MRLRRTVLLVIWFTAPACLALPNRPTSFRQPENQVVNSEVRRPLLDIQPANAGMGCERTQTAVPLATPGPLLSSGAKIKIAVSFIIGMDGRVHSPVILESAGTDEDRSVLDAVLSWRYRPATCNAVPAEAEAKVEFSSR